MRSPTGSGGNGLVCSLHFSCCCMCRCLKASSRRSRVFLSCVWAVFPRQDGDEVFHWPSEQTHG